MVTDVFHNKHQKKWLPAATMVLCCAKDHTGFFNILTYASNNFDSNFSCITL